MIRSGEAFLKHSELFGRIIATFSASPTEQSFWDAVHVRRRLTPFQRRIASGNVSGRATAPSPPPRRNLARSPKSILGLGVSSLIRAASVTSKRRQILGDNKRGWTKPLRGIRQD